MNYRRLIVPAVWIAIGPLGLAACQGGENVLPLPPDGGADGSQDGKAGDGSSAGEAGEAGPSVEAGADADSALGEQE
jgi:hypothetical protein